MSLLSHIKHTAKSWSKNPLPSDGVCLALGGGAVLGAAHIGVLKALSQKKISVKQISGTSIGALIATLYAFGKTPDDIEHFVSDLAWLDVTSFTLSKYGILSNDDLGRRLDDYLGQVHFSETVIPLFLVATDISNGKKVILKQGRIAKAVMASSCIPGVFVPVDIEDRLLVDGGLVENVPISPFQELKDETFIIGVDLNAGRHYERPEDIVDVFANAIDIAIDNFTRSQLKTADLIIAPELSSYSRRDTSRVTELINEGYQAALKVLEKVATKPSK